MDKDNIIKHYHNTEITVKWESGKCIHSGICFRGLSTVFDPKKRPWINIDGADTESIVKQVKQCPSGALSIEDAVESSTQTTIIEAMENGPLLVYGTIKIKDKAGNEIIKNKTTALCRCGASGNKPYCDGTHTKIGFED